MPVIHSNRFVLHVSCIRRKTQFPQCKVPPKKNTKRHYVRQIFIDTTITKKNIFSKIPAILRFCLFKCFLHIICMQIGHTFSNNIISNGFFHLGLITMNKFNRLKSHNFIYIFIKYGLDGKINQKLNVSNESYHFFDTLFNFSIMIQST